MRLLVPIVIVLSLWTAFASASVPGEVDAEARLVVDLTDVDRETLEAALEGSDGELLRIDPVLGFAVVRVDDADRFAEDLGTVPLADARGGGGSHAPVAHVPDDDLYQLQWGPTELNMPQAWNVEAGDPTAVEVAIVDSGIDLFHTDLDDVPVRLGWDYVEWDPYPQDDHDHGTHVAGIVAAERDNGQGIAGVADVSLYVNRVFDANNAGWCSDMASAIREAVDAGVDVINFSGWCSIDFPPLADAVAYSDQNEVLFVTITGNFQTSNPALCVTYPGAYPEAVAVAAINAAHGPATFSCQGPETDLAAPGDTILSTVAGGGYAFFSGTSMAAPHVAATAALLLSSDPGLDALSVRDRLVDTARDLGPPGHDEVYGHGVVDPVAALTGSPVFTSV